MLAATFRRYHACLGALNDECPLKFGQSGHDVKDKPAAGRRGIDTVSERLESDTSLAAPIHEVDQEA